MDITFKIPAHTFDEIATEVTRRVLVQLGRANDEVPTTKDAPVVAPTVEQEDPSTHLGEIGKTTVVLSELRELGKQIITSGITGGRDKLIAVLTDHNAQSLSSLREDQYPEVAADLQGILEGQK